MFLGLVSVVTWALPLIAAFGGAVLIAAMWPRRVTLRPRCGTCGYSVSEHLPEQCPECGTELTVEAIRVGPRFGFLPRMLVAVIAFVFLVAFTHEYLSRHKANWAVTGWIVERYDAKGQEFFAIRSMESMDKSDLWIRLSYPQAPMAGDPVTDELLIGISIFCDRHDRTGSQIRMSTPPRTVTRTVIATLVDAAKIDEELRIIGEVQGDGGSARDSLIDRLFQNVQYVAQQDPNGPITLREIVPATSGNATHRVLSSGELALTPIRARAPTPWWHPLVGRGRMIGLIVVGAVVLAGMISRSHTRRLHAAGLACGDSD